MFNSGTTSFHPWKVKLHVLAITTTLLEKGKRVETEREEGKGKVWH